jgi:hypothetical protein
MTARHVTAGFAIAYVHFVTDGAVTLTVGQIRVWAHRGHIKRVGTDLSGFALYDLDGIVRRAQPRAHLHPSEPKV